MMRTILTIAILCGLLLPPAAAQQVKWSQPQRSANRNIVTEVIGQSANGLYVVKRSWRRQERELTIEKYSDDLRLLASQDYINRRGEAYQRVFLHGEKLHLYYTLYDKSSNTTALRVKRLNPSLKAEVADTTLFTLEGNRSDDPNLAVVKQQQSTDVLILSTPTQLDIPERLDCMLLDSSLKNLKASHVHVGFSNKYEVEQVAYSGERLCMMVREDIPQRVNNLGYRFYLFDGMFGSDAYEETLLFNDSINVIEGLLKTDLLNGQIVFAGLYGARDSAYSKGYYTWRKNLGDGKVLAGPHAFNTMIVHELAGKRSKIQGVYHLRAGDIALRADGGIIFTSEEYQESRETIMDMNMYGMTQTNFRFNYFYENLLVLSIGADDGLDWHTVVRKEQVSSNDNGMFSSYLLSVMPEKLIYVFNDISRKNWNLSAYEINANGVGQNAVIIRSQEYDGHLVPQYGQQIAYNEFLIPGDTRRGLVLLKVSYTP